MDKPSATARRPTATVDRHGNADVHYSSGVGNHFFYLLAEGSGARTINGIAAQLADLQRLDA